MEFQTLHLNGKSSLHSFEASCPVVWLGSYVRSVHVLWLFAITVSLLEKCLVF